MFWPAGSEGEAVSGRLEFDPEDGGRLTLVGRSPDEELSLATTESTVPIEGLIDQGPVTITDFFLGGTTSGSSKATQGTVHINCMFLGHHFGSERLEFQTAYLKTSGATEWVGEAVLADRVSTESDKISPPAEWLNYTTPPDRTCSFARGDVTVRYVWTSNSGFDSVDFKHWPIFALQYPKLAPLDLIQRDIDRLSDLITLCTNGVTTTERLSVSRPDIRTVMLSGDLGPVKEIDYLAPQLSYAISKRRKPRRSHHMLLTFEEVGGVDAIAKWLDASPVFGRALGSMMSVQRTSRIYTENRFLNVAFAAEAFHRDLHGGQCMSNREFAGILADCLAVVPEQHKRWLEQRLQFANSLSLRARLKDLVARTGDLLTPLLGKTREWVDLVTNVRNHLTHLDSTKAGFRGGDLYLLSESVYSVVRICMLLEIGVRKEVLAEKVGSYSLSWYAPRLADAVLRMKRQLRDAVPAEPDGGDQA